MSLYESVLGNDWATLDPSVRSFLTASDSCSTSSLTISNGNWGPSRFAARMFGLPRPGKNLHVDVLRYCKDGRDMWERRFPDVTIVSEQWAEDGLIAEKMGIVVCRFQLRVASGALMLQHHSTFISILGWRLCLPRALSPIIQAYVEPSPEPLASFVHVSLWLPLVRIVLAYTGTVKLHTQAW